MIETIIALISLFGLFAVLVAKIINLSKNGKFYGSELIIIGLILSLFCWGMYFMTANYSMDLTQTVTTGADVSTIENNDYVILFGFLPIVNFLFTLCGFFTVMEIILKGFNWKQSKRIDFS